MRSLDNKRVNTRSGDAAGRAKRLLATLLAGALLVCCIALAWGCGVGAAGTDAGASGPSSPAGQSVATPAAAASVTEDGSYTSKDDVALYLHLYGHLPGNFVTKAEARAAGWDSSSNYVGDACPGKSIGGDRFYNDDGLLPDAAGRRYYECDIDYGGAKRGAERIVFSDDGLVFYTADHYNTFEQLY